MRLDLVKNSPWLLTASAGWPTQLVSVVGSQLMDDRRFQCFNMLSDPMRNELQAILATLLVSIRGYVNLIFSIICFVLAYGV